MPKVVVIGSRGRLGQAFVKYGKFPGYEICPLNARINDKFSGDNFLGLNEGDILLNCAAYTNVKESENEFIRCWATNTILPAFLVEKSEQIGFNLVLFSTDYSIRSEYHHHEYTKSKMRMERECAGQGLIIRLSNLIGEDDIENSKVNLVIKLLESDEISVGDITIYPTLLNEKTVRKLCKVIMSNRNKIMNCFGPEYKLSDFVKELYQECGKPLKLSIKDSPKIDRIRKRHTKLFFDWSFIKSCIKC